MITDLWTEKYRPTKTDDYVWRDEKQKSQVEKWIKEKNIPHILLSGSPGLGKSSLISVLLSELEVRHGDILRKNASDKTGVDFVADVVQPFASTVCFGPFKVIVLEEADGMSQQSQQALKRIMEDYADNTRFILTTNHPHKIFPAIHSRCQTFHMTSLDKDQFRLRLAEILVNESVEADVEVLDNYVAVTYPDLRKAINSMQMNSIEKKLQSPSKDSGTKEEFFFKTIELVKSGKLTESREYLCANVSYEDYDSVYRFMYENRELWGDSTEQQDDAIIAIKRGIVADKQVADREINLSATMVELARIKNR